MYSYLVWTIFQVPPGGNRSQYEEIDIPVALLSYTDMLDIGKVNSVLNALIHIISFKWVIAQQYLKSILGALVL